MAFNCMSGSSSFIFGPASYHPDYEPLTSITQMNKKDNRRLACDRCHGQKLRCPPREANQERCPRCLRAGAVCNFSPPLRIGRPSGRKSSAQDSTYNCSSTRTSQTQADGRSNRTQKQFPRQTTPLSAQPEYPSTLYAEAMGAVGDSMPDYWPQLEEFSTPTSAPTPMIPAVCEPSAAMDTSPMGIEWTTQATWSGLPTHEGCSIGPNSAVDSATDLIPDLTNLHVRLYRNIQEHNAPADGHHQYTTGVTQTPYNNAMADSEIPADLEPIASASQKLIETSNRLSPILPSTPPEPLLYSHPACHNSAVFSDFSPSLPSPDSLGSLLPNVQDQSREAAYVSPAVMAGMDVRQQEQRAERRIHKPCDQQSRYDPATGLLLSSCYMRFLQLCVCVVKSYCLRLQSLLVETERHGHPHAPRSEQATGETAFRQTCRWESNNVFGHTSDGSGMTGNSWQEILQMAMRLQMIENMTDGVKGAVCNTLQSGQFEMKDETTRYYEEQNELSEYRGLRNAEEMLACQINSCKTLLRSHRAI